MAVVIVSLLVFRNVPESLQLLFFSCLAGLTSLAFFRHSRSLWITVDFWVHPWAAPVQEQTIQSGSHETEPPIT